MLPTLGCIDPNSACMVTAFCFLSLDWVGNGGLRLGAAKIEKLVSSQKAAQQQLGAKLLWSMSPTEPAQPGRGDAEQDPSLAVKELYGKTAEKRVTWGWRYAPRCIDYKSCNTFHPANNSDNSDLAF